MADGSINLQGFTIIRNSSSSDLKASLIVRQPDDIVVSAFFMVRQTSSANLLAPFIVRQSTYKDLLSSFVARQSSSSNIKGFSIVRNLGSQNVHAFFIVRTSGSKNVSSFLIVRHSNYSMILQSFIVRQSGSKNIKGHFIVRQSSSQNLHAKFILPVANLLAHLNVQTYPLSFPKLHAHFYVTSRINLHAFFNVNQYNDLHAFFVVHGVGASNLHAFFSTMHDSHMILRGDDFSGFFETNRTEGVGVVGTGVVTDETPPVQGSNYGLMTISSGTKEVSKLIRDLFVLGAVGVNVELPSGILEVENYTSRMQENCQQYRVHYDPTSGRDYVFYAYGNLVAYKHKLHGDSVWSSRITGWTPASAPGYSLVNAFDIFFDGNWLYMVFFYVGTGFKLEYFRRGQFNANGTITWSAAWKAFSGSYYHYFPTIIHDGNRVYIAFQHYDSGDVPPYKYYIFRSTDGLAGQTWGGPYTIDTSGGAPYPAGSNRLLVCTSGIALVHGNGTGQTRVVFSTDQGGTWSSPVYFSEVVYLGDGRAVAIGDIVHLCYFYRPASGNYQFRHRYITFGGTEWSSYETVKDKGNNSGYIGISAFKEGNNLIAVEIDGNWSDATLSDPMVFTYVDGVWSGGESLGINSTSQWYPNTDREAPVDLEGKYIVLLSWARKIYTSPYYIEFAQFRISDVPATPQALDWKPYSHIAFYWMEFGTGSVPRLKIFNNQNYREELLPDTGEPLRFLIIPLRSMGGSPDFDWTEVTGMELDFFVTGLWGIDQIWLFGCPPLPANFTIRNAGTKNLRAFLNVMQIADIHASFSVTNAGSYDLKNVLNIRQSSTKNLHATMTILNQATNDLNAFFNIQRRNSLNIKDFFVLRNASAKNLKYMFIVRNSSTANILASCFVYLLGSSNLSASLNVRQIQIDEMKATLWVRRPLAFVDQEAQIQESIGGIV